MTPVCTNQSVMKCWLVKNITPFSSPSFAWISLLSLELYVFILHDFTWYSFLKYMIFLHFNCLFFFFNFHLFLLNYMIFFYLNWVTCFPTELPNFRSLELHDIFYRQVQLQRGQGQPHLLFSVLRRSIFQ